jgi:Predicted esterase of the alpha-beta hydrolase superfamily
MNGNGNVDNSLSFWLFDSITRLFSPYQFNPLNYNPLRDVLGRLVNFDRLHACKCTNLFISATNVRTGKARVFRNEEIDLDMVMASACLPLLFQAVQIDGDYYWDGGFMGNPVLYPFFYHTSTNDIVIIHINPLEHEELPTDPVAIQDRINEITFNGSLIKELRSVAFVTKLLEEGWLKEEYQSHFKHVLIHSIRADDALRGLSVSSKFNCN